MHDNDMETAIERKDEQAIGRRNLLKLTGAGVAAIGAASVFTTASARCLIPDFDGAIFSHDWREALWARFYTAAPQRLRQSVEQYKIVKRA